MLIKRLWLLATLLGWAGAVGTYRELSTGGVRKWFLQVQNATKNDFVAVEAVLSDAVARSAQESEVARMRRLKREFDVSWRNNLVIIPCLLVATPLLYIWYKTESVGKGDEIFTATDSDLREVEIRSVGASGVALLRRQCDRHTGIMFAFTGIMLQTIFLYFIGVFCGLRIYKQAIFSDTGTPTPVALIFCSLFCNTMTCCSSMILGLKCWNTTAPAGYQQLHNLLVFLDSFFIPSMCAVIGALYLCTSNGISSLVFSSTSMAFICSINMQIAGLMSWSLSGHGGRAFQPANVSIKDSENTTMYAHYSFIASVVVALLTLPLGFVFGII